jgi:hypothetical protein
MESIYAYQFRYCPVLYVMEENSEEGDRRKTPTEEMKEVVEV